MALEEARIRNSTLVVVHNSADEEIAALRTELAATGIPHSIERETPRWSRLRNSSMPQRRRGQTSSSLACAADPQWESGC